MATPAERVRVLERSGGEQDVAGTEVLRLDFFELAAGRLAEAGMSSAFIERVGPNLYLARYCVEDIPFEVIVKKQKLPAAIADFARPTARSSGPNAGAMWTIPVPSSIETNVPATTTWASSTFAYGGSYRTPTRSAPARVRTITPVSPRTASRSGAPTTSRSPSRSTTR